MKSLDPLCFCLPCSAGVIVGDVDDVGVMRGRNTIGVCVCGGVLGGRKRFDKLDGGFLLEDLVLSGLSILSNMAGCRGNCALWKVFLFVLNLPSRP